MNEFLPQIACFAVAHLCYISYFIGRYRYNRFAPYLLAVECIAVALISSVIIPRAGEGLQLYFVIAYIIIISVMCAASIFNDSKRYWWYVAAAFLFLVSDSIIALNRFAVRIPDSAAYIMSTYYTAQLIFAITAIRDKSAKVKMSE